jgi:hypothetical protein
MRLDLDIPISEIDYISTRSTTRITTRGTSSTTRARAKSKAIIRYYFKDFIVLT